MIDDPVFLALGPYATAQEFRDYLQLEAQQNTQDGQEPAPSPSSTLPPAPPEV